MKTYIITEKENLNSHRAPMAVQDFKSLAAAKRYATKNQAFFGTVLTISDTNGELLSIKQGSSKWING